jgi:hypothetical protein
VGVVGLRSPGVGLFLPAWPVEDLCMSRFYLHVKHDGDLINDEEGLIFRH